jgi:heat shock protein HslJ
MKAVGAFRHALIAVAAVLTACASVSTMTASLEGTRWTVAGIDGAATPRTDAYRLEFRDGRIGGKFGCNSFSGRYSVARDTLTAANVAATKMACPGPADTFESQGFAVLAQPMQLQWHSGSRVTLANAAGSIALERLP